MRGTDYLQVKGIFHIIIMLLKPPCAEESALEKGLEDELRKKVVFFIGLGSSKLMNGARAKINTPFHPLTHDIQTQILFPNTTCDKRKRSGPDPCFLRPRSFFLHLIFLSADFITVTVDCSF